MNDPQSNATAAEQAAQAPDVPDFVPTEVTTPPQYEHVPAPEPKPIEDMAPPVTPDTNIPPDQLASDGDQVVEGLPDDGGTEATA